MTKEVAKMRYHFAFFVLFSHRWQHFSHAKSPANSRRNLAQKSAEQQLEVV